MTKTGRKEVDNGREVFWTEFYDKHGNRIRLEGDRTPECEGGE